MVSRLSSIALALLPLLLVAAPACARGSREASSPAAAGGSADAARWGEAPLLAARTAAGELPPAAERLPADPFVVDVGGAASYGGTWRQAMARESLPSLWTSGIRARLVGLSADLSTVVPELLAAVEVSSDLRVYTLALRDGLRWSDGERCDADDLLFAFRDVLLDPELWPAKPAELVAGGRLPRLEKVDATTVRYTFASPNGLFLRRLAQPRVDVPLLLPEHYLRTFHVKYAKKEELAALVDRGGYAGWAELFADMSRPWVNAELPVLDAWRLADAGAEGTVRLERNPYFWQVDGEGRQLPYFDGIEVAIVDGADAGARATPDAVDLQIAGLPLAVRAALAEAPAAGQGVLRVELEPMEANIHTLFLNPTVADPAKAKLFADERFRRALSVSIDRDEIARVVHGGRGRPSQVAPPPSAASYDEEAALSHTAYDPEAAAALLDEIGLSWDAAGLRRIGPDGKPLTLTVSYPVSWPPGQVTAATLIREQLGKAGIVLRGEALDRAAFSGRVARGAWELAMYAVDIGGGAYLPLSSNGVFPTDGWWMAGPDWGRWLATRGAEGVEPPAAVKTLHALYGEYTGAATAARAAEIEREAFGAYARGLLAIGVLSRPRGESFGVRAARLAGLPAGTIVDDLSLYHPAAFHFVE